MSRLQVPVEKNHWFSFRDSCVSVTERRPEVSIKQGENALFFLHGRFGHSLTWQPVTQRLASQYKCISLDLPGYGRSFLIQERGFSLFENVNLVCSLLDFLTDAREKVVLVGHDVGGALAQLCMLKHPEKIAGLVLINSTCVASKLTRIRPGPCGAFARWKLHRLLHQSHLQSSDTKKLLCSAWGKHSARKSLIRSLRSFDESWPWNQEQKTWKESLKKVALPVLILWGASDALNPLQAGLEMMQEFKDAYFFSHDQSGHWPQFEQPSWVVSKIKEFIFKIGYGANIKLDNSYYPPYR